MQDNVKSHITQFIKTAAANAGFSFCGIAKAEQLPDEARKLERWLNQGKHGKMGYMENYFDKRIDPTQLMPGAKSVISLLYNYFPEQTLSSSLKIAKYAYGEDYHDVIKEKLRLLVTALQQEVGDFEARIFVDSAPVLEKAWAQKSGLGWQGKNTNLINPKLGSFYFLAEIICDLPLHYDHPIKDYCGTCTACVDACPTDALVEPYQIDASKCISYLTIELKDALIPEQFHGKMENWIFGCDICQDVCPWNRFAKQHQEPKFLPTDDLKNVAANDWKEVTAEIFNQVFKHSAIKRTKWSGWERNITTAKIN
ncbi:MAG: tRNA epoxyqueuosine(34) reductase QueG [Bacteroidetes bacterium]|nr:tRNA epoxyqueuosine(34) reductase QueG [Bacteroidota bacterium]